MDLVTKHIRYIGLSPSTGGGDDASNAQTVDHYHAAITAGVLSIPVRDTDGAIHTNLNIGEIALLQGGTHPDHIAILKRYAPEHTVLSIMSPPESMGANEATIALSVGDTNTSVIDYYNNWYPSETQAGIRISKFGTKEWQDFVIDYYNDTNQTKDEVLRINKTTHNITIPKTLTAANLSGSNTGDQTLSGLGGIAHSLATAVNDFLVASGAGVFVKKTLAETKTILGLSGSNTGDETTTTIKSKLGITTLSGSNTGDETTTTIKSKLGITTLSGSNTGDQTLSGLGGVAKSGDSMTGDLTFSISVSQASKGILWSGLTDTHKIFVEEYGAGETTRLVLHNIDNGDSDYTVIRSTSGSTPKDVFEARYTYLQTPVQIRSSLASGTPPFTVVSGSKVLLLNVDQIDDCDVETVLTSSTNKIPRSNAVKAVTDTKVSFTGIETISNKTFPSAKIASGSNGVNLIWDDIEKALNFVFV